jgi:hypothetical protein
MAFTSSPFIDQIGYTSARITIPAAGDWPSGVTVADLYIRKDGDSYSDTPTIPSLSPDDVIIADTLEEETTYYVKLVGVAVSSSSSSSSNVIHESPEVSFSTLDGTPGDSVVVSLPGEAAYPDEPSPVTFDNPKSTSVDVLHLGTFPSNSDDVILRYRQLGAGSWIEHPTVLLSSTINDPINVTGLTEDTTYEFKFVARNSNLGVDRETEGDIARYLTNLGTDPGETIPAAPILENLDYAEGMTSVLVTLPDLVGAATEYELQYTTNPSVSWDTFVEGSSSSSSSSLADNQVIVTGLTPDTRYYFRVVALTYVGLVSSIYTLPELPVAPGLVTFSETGGTYINAVLPLMPLRADSLILKRGVGPDQDNITWEKEWPNLSASETINDTLLTPDTVYWYRAVAVNESGEVEGPVSQSDTWITLPDAPNGLIFDYVGGSFVDMIIPTMPDKASRMSLESGLSIGALSTIESSLVTDSSYIDLGLSPNTLNFYRLVSHNSVGSTQGCIVGIQTRLSDEIGVVPAPNAILTGLNEVTVTAPLISEWPMYVNELVLVYRDSTGDFIENNNTFGESVFGNAMFGNSIETNWVTLAIHVYALNPPRQIIITDASDTPIVAGHTYEFKWIAKNDASEYSGPATTISLEAPSEPAKPTLSATTTTVTVTPPALPSAAYEFNIKRLDGSSWITIATNRAPNVAFLDDTPAKVPNTPYSYKVEAVGYYGTTDGPSESITTDSNAVGSNLPSEPPTPTIDSKTYNSIVVDVPTMASDWDYLMINYRLINGSWANPDDRIVGLSSTYSISGLNEDSYYEIVWTAYNSNGNTRGESYIEVTDIRPPEKPGDLIVTNG